MTYNPELYFRYTISANIEEPDAGPLKLTRLPRGRESEVPSSYHSQDYEELMVNLVNELYDNSNFPFGNVFSEVELDSNLEMVLSEVQVRTIKRAIESYHRISELKLKNCQIIETLEDTLKSNSS